MMMLLLQEIYKDRKKFSRAVFEVASSDLVNMGICVVSYTLKDIHDDEVSQFNCAIHIFMYVLPKALFINDVDTQWHCLLVTVYTSG